MCLPTLVANPELSSEQIGVEMGGQRGGAARAQRDPRHPHLLGHIPGHPHERVAHDANHRRAACARDRRRHPLLQVPRRCLQEQADQLEDFPRRRRFIRDAVGDGDETEVRGVVGRGEGSEGPGGAEEGDDGGGGSGGDGACDGEDGSRVGTEWECNEGYVLLGCRGSHGGHCGWSRRRETDVRMFTEGKCRW